MATRLRGMTDGIIQNAVGTRNMIAGMQYLRADRVSDLLVHPAGELVSASVQGNRPTAYSVIARPDKAGRWSGHCSCPMQVNCKHVAAALLAARAGEKEPSAQRAPEWESHLQALVEPPAATATTSTPLALHFELVDANGGRRVRLRPMLRSTTGKWVRTGATWRDFQYDYTRSTQPAAQRAVLKEMLRAYESASSRYYMHGSEKVHLDELGLGLWHLLDSARSAGIELLTGKDDPVALVPPVRASLDLREDAGGVALHPGIVVGDRVLEVSAVTLVDGALPGVVATDPDSIAALLAEQVWTSTQPPALALAALEGRPHEQVTALLRRGRILHVPEGEVPRFFASYYPALRQLVEVTTSDGSVRPPEIRPPVLAVTVHFGDDLGVELAWVFDYRDGADASITRVPVEPEPATAEASTRVGTTRDHGEERRLLGAVATHRDFVAPHLHLDGMQAVRFATEVLPVLQASGDVDVTVVGEAPDFRAAALPPVISLATSDTDDRDWFDLAVTVTVEDQPVPFDQLFRALATDQSHLVLPSGLYLPLDAPELLRLRQLIEEARGLQDRASKGLRVSVFQAGLWEELVELGVVQAQSARWSAAVSGLLHLEKLEPPAEPDQLQATLRPYQVEGFHWLAFLWRHGLGGILADDMGLGKTLQALALVSHAKESGPLAGPFLVVAPTSVVGNWAREAEKFAPGLTVRAVTETTRKRGTPLADDIAGADLVITSYALFRIDEDAYQAQDWAGLVLDEAQYVKNHQAKTYQCARRLSAPFKLAVTGTPLENSLMDLWSLLSIVAPGLYPSPQRFAEDNRRPIERGDAPELLARLRRRVRPLMLRRTKEQVVAELPPKQEQVLEVVLDPKHQKVYQTHLQRERRKVLGLLDDLDRNRFEILKSLTLLRQLSLAPALVDDAYAAVPASKVEVFVETLREVVDEGHRALVFSQFTGFLKIVRDRLDAEGIRHCYLDGRTRKRAERIEEFKTGDAPVFLISLKAGGVGLNLTEADYCFILDPWWNPAVEAQAVDRTHRIGQDKTVMVYRMVATGTIEEKVMELKARKQSLFDQVVGGDDMMAAPLSVEDIKGLFG